MNNVVSIFLLITNICSYYTSGYMESSPGHWASSQGYPVLQSMALLAFHRSSPEAKFLVRGLEVAQET